MIARTLRLQRLARKICLDVSLTSILVYFGGADGLCAAQAHRPFAAFNVKVEIDIEDGEVEVWSNLTLGGGSKGLDLPTKTVSLEVKGGTGAYSVIIPPGSFKKDGSGRFTFHGTIDRVKMEGSIRPLRDGAFEFEVQTEGANLKGFANPVTVSLTIGDDGGGRTVRAKIE
jgi:hypothetical protein